MDYIAALSRFSNGLYIITTSDGGKDNAMLATVATQVSSEPITLMVGIAKSNLTHETIAKTGKFNLSVASINAKIEFLGAFGFKSGRNEDKLNGVKTVPGANGIPCVTEGCTSYFECQVTGEYDLTKYTLFFAEVTNSVVLSPDKSMTLDHYQQVLNGTISQNSPAWAARYTR